MTQTSVNNKNKKNIILVSYNIMYKCLCLTLRIQAISNKGRRIKKTNKRLQTRERTP